MNRGFTLYDFLFVLFCCVLCFVVFFSIIENDLNRFDKLTQYLIITENAISKNNLEGIGFAKIDNETKTTLQNTIENPKLIDPIKRIELYDENNKIFDIGNDCEKQIKLSRLAIYEDKIVKAVFTFCE